MSAKLHILNAALDDLQNALDWYDLQSTGLEQRFSKEINERLTFISVHPEASPIRAEDFRGAQLKKFPYTIYYDFDDIQNVVYVAAVLHNKRDRNVLQKRR
jgi:plasmid stabilization system protein ParE